MNRIPGQTVRVHPDHHGRRASHQKRRRRCPPIPRRPRLHHHRGRTRYLETGRDCLPAPHGGLEAQAEAVPVRLAGDCSVENSCCDSAWRMGRLGHELCRAPQQACLSLGLGGISAGEGEIWFCFPVKTAPCPEQGCESSEGKLAHPLRNPTCPLQSPPRSRDPKVHLCRGNPQHCTVSWATGASPRQTSKLDVEATVSSHHARKLYAPRTSPGPRPALSGRQ